MQKTRRIVVLPLIAAAVVIALLLVFFGCRQQNLKRTQSEALAELNSRVGEYDPQSIVLSNTNRGEAEALAEKLGAKLRITKDGRFAALTLEEGRTVADVFADEAYLSELSKLSADWSIRVAELEDEPEDIEEALLESRVRRPEYSVSDPYYSAQTYLDYMNLSNVWSVTKGAGITVAVIDSGIDTDHPEFAGRISEWSYNASEDKIVKDYGDWSLIEDEFGHGTAVAGVIGAAMDGSGTVGVAPEVTLLVIKAEMDADGKYFRRTSDLVFGLYYAIERNAKVVNMSFGGESNEFAKPLQLAVDSDIICIASAGNESSAAPCYPASDPNCIGVGALAVDGWGLADYSNYGENTDVVAPGTTLTTAVGGGYKTESGTSLSAPAVTGAVALYLSRNRYTEYRDLREVLLASACDIGSPGPDFYFGYGAVDVSSLVLEEKGTITFDYLTDEIDATTQVFVRSHTLQAIPEPERLYAVFDGWYYDDQCTDEFDLYRDRFTEDLTLYAGWANEDDGIPYTYAELADGTIEIESYTGHRRYIVIPSYIDGKVVSSIGSEAFKNETRLRQVTLPAQLEQIKARAFSGCSALSAISIPDTVTWIGEEAFKDAVRLSGVTLGSGSKLRSVGKNAFQSCIRLREFTLPASANDIDGSAFFGCTGITAFRVSAGNSAYTADSGVLYNASQTLVVAYPAGLRGNYDLPDTVRQIGDSAFAYSSLTELDLKQAEKLGESAFAFSRLRTIAIPDSVTEMGKEAFSSCSALASVTLGEGLSVIPEKAFYLCESLEPITIPLGITRIGEEAFTFSGLKSLEFEDKSRLESIGNGAFSSTKLSSLSLPETLQIIGSNAFSGIASLAQVSFASDGALQRIGDHAFANDSNLSTVVFPDGLITLGEYAFAYSGLTAATIPAGLTDLGPGAFASCQDLTAINVDAGNSTFQSVSSVVYSADGKTVVAYPCGASDVSYAIPEGTEVVYHAAFYGARQLSSILLPETLREIGYESFYDCSALRRIEIPNNVTQISRLAFGLDWNLTDISFRSLTESKLARIGFQAFADCGINRFTVPSSVSHMAQYAFDGCRNLSSIEFAANSRLESISAYLFDGCDNLQSISFSTGSALTTLQAHAFDGLRRLQTVDFGDARLTSVGNFAFRGCTALGSFTVPEGVTYLGRYAFYQCTSLSEVSLPSSLEYIGRYAFLGTGDAQIYFTSESLPETLQEGWDGDVLSYYLGVQSINNSGDWKYAQQSSGGVALLAYTGSAKTVDLSALDFGTITSIGGRAFAYRGVEQVVIPETVTVIQNEAFYASELKALNVPASVTFIGQKAFAHTPIETLTFAENAQLSTIERSAFEGTEKLAGVVIPKSVTSLGSAAFKRSGIRSLTFEAGSGLTEIPKQAFAYTGITSLSIPDSVGVIRDDAFRETKALKTLNFGAHPDLKIRANAFYLSGLTSLSIPENVTYIGDCAFIGMENLTAYQVAAGNPYYQSADGLLLSKNGRKLIAAPAGKTGSLTVPAGVEVIGTGAFERSRLSAISFPSDANILTFGCRAFFGMENLTGITIPASVVSIDYYAFAYCEKLKTVNFAEGNLLTGVYEGAFCGDVALSDIRLPKTVVEITDFAFYACESLTEFPSVDSTALRSIDSYAMAYTGLSGELTTPENLIDIGAYAFMGIDCYKITVPDARQEELMIGLGAFEACNRLEEFSVPFIGRSLDDGEHTWFGYIFGAGAFTANEAYVPESLKSVSITGNLSEAPLGAFYKCSQLEQLNLPDTIKEVYPYAFYKCAGQFELKAPISLISTAVDDPDHYNGMHGTYFYKSGVSGKLIIQKLQNDVLESNAFYDCIYLEAVRLPNTVKIINREAFFNCSSLSDIVLPETIDTIGYAAFYHCISLKSIALPAALKTITGSAFSGCTSLRRIVIPEGVSQINEYAFLGCTGLVSVSLPQSLAEIAPTAFDYCEGLSEITNNSSLKLVFDSDAYGCVAKNAKKIVDSDGSITYPQGTYETQDGFVYEEFNGKYRIVAYLGDCDPVVFPDKINGEEYSIYRIRGVNSVILPDGIKAIDEMAFFSCETLTSIIIPDSVSSIGVAAFATCRNMKEITIPDSVVYIGSSAFSSCENLTSITLPEGLQTIERETFLQCYSLKQISLPSTLTRIEDWAFYNCNKLTYISLPEGLISIGANAFERCSSLEELWIPKTVTNIDSGAFNGCSLLRVSFDAEQDYFREKDLVIYNGDYTSILFALPQASNVTLPETITDIPDEAFKRCTNLEQITFSSGLTYIGNAAFSGCKLLKEVDFPESLTTIDSEAFAQCTSLKRILIPDTVTDLGSYVFYDCTSLEEAEIRTALKELPDGMFGGCISLKKVIIPEGVEILGDAIFHSCSNLQNITLPNSIKNIGALSFSHCSSLSDIQLPDSLETIGREAFVLCKNLNKLLIPDGVTTISNSAFNLCRGLSAITLPKNLTTIGNYAFSDCGGLKQIVNNSNISLDFGSQANGNISYNAVKIIDPDGTVRFKDGYFETPDGFLVYEQEGIFTVVGYAGESDTVRLPDSVNEEAYGISCFSGARCVIIPGCKKSVDFSGFYQSTSLNRIIIEEGVEEIGDYAFAGCENLEEISLPKSLKNIFYGAFDSCGYSFNEANWDNGLLYIDSYLIEVQEGVRYFDLKRDTLGFADNIYQGNSTLKCVYGRIEYQTFSSANPFALSNVETVIAWNEPIILSDSHDTLKNVIIPDNITGNDIQDSYITISGLTFWVEQPEYECRWDENYPGWNNGNKVVYGDDWSYSSFYGLDGKLIYRTPHRNSAVIIRPYYRAESDAQYDYTIGWDLDGDGAADTLPATSTEDIVARAVITGRTLRKYTVTFKDYDGTVLSSRKYACGSTVTTPEQPVRSSDDPHYRYEFADWGRPIEPVTGDIVYIATYSRTTTHPADINGSWSFDTYDAAYLLLHFTCDARAYPLPMAEDRYDLNGDGVLNQNDALWLLFNEVFDLASPFDELYIAAFDRLGMMERIVAVGRDGTLSDDDLSFLKDAKDIRFFYVDVTNRPVAEHDIFLR